MGIPPPCWTAADGVEVFGWMPDALYYTTPIRKKMWEFGIEIAKKHELDFRWKHSRIGYCTWASVIMRNTDQTLNLFKTDKEKFCPTCRGKGHPWKCEIWNGRAYNGHPSGKEWKHPIKCQTCNGKGIL